MQKIPGSKKTHIILMDSQVAKLDEIGGRFNISRSEALRRIVETGLDSYCFYEGLGVVKLAEVSKRIRKAIEKDVQPTLYGV
jgi:hypothetical protein